jgi:hypothetical protein
MYHYLKYIAIFALFAACENTDCHTCEQVTISDANPIQFWHVDCDTFNEQEVDGVFPKCFCQPWECGDPLRFQFQEDTDSEFELKVYDSDGAIVHIFDFDNTYQDVWDLVFTPDEFSPDLCDQKVQFKIVELGNIVQNPSFDLGSSNWSNSGPGGNWAVNNGAAEITFINSAQSSRLFNQTLPQSYSGQIKIVVLFTLSNAVSNSTVIVNYGGVDQSFVVPGAGTYLREIWVDAASFNTIYLAASTTDGSGLAKVMSVKYVKIISSGNQTIRAKSDCVWLKETWKETKLINFWNTSRNFAGLIYHTSTPSIEFSIRIPAIFYRERPQQESETMELSNSRSVQTFAQLKTQKLLAIKEMPFYMHKKAILALQHQFVEMDDIAYMKAEQYEMQPPSNPRYALDRAQVWLTEKNFIARNVL